MKRSGVVGAFLAFLFLFPVSAFAQVFPIPVVSSVSPTSGATTGGTVVTITGMNFDGATAVTFAGTAATSFTVLNTNQIMATAPAGAAGAADVQVTTPGGQTFTNAGDVFTYVAPAPVPTLSAAGLIIFALVMMTGATLFVHRRRITI